MKKQFIYLAWLLLHPFLLETIEERSLYAQSTYRFENIEAPDEVSIAGAHAIVQDSLGFLWVHYPTGLARYDGYSFKDYPYDPEDSLRSPGSVLDGRMMLDRSGNVWIKNLQVHSPSNTLELSRYDPSIDGFVKYKPNVGESGIFSLCFDRSESIIWLGTLPGRGLYAFDVKTGETKRYINTPSLGPTDFTKKATEQMNVVFSISDFGPSLLLATWKGLWQFDKKSKTFTRPQCDPKDSVLLYHYPVFEIFDKKANGAHNLWVTAVGFGENWTALVKLGEGFSVVQRFDVPDEFRFNDLRSGWSNADIDAEGVFWITSKSRGLVRFDPRDSSMIGITDDGKPYSLKSAPKSFGTAVKTGPKQLETVPDKFTALQGVLVDREQNVWVASENWISKLKRPALDLHSYVLDYPINVSTFYTWKGKNILVASIAIRNSKGYQELAMAEIDRHRLNSVKFTKISPDPPITGLVNWLHMGKHHLWIGTDDNGVASLSIDSVSGSIIRNSLKVFRHDPQNLNTISSNSIYGVWEDSHENLWAGTPGYGLNRIVSPAEYGTEGSVIKYLHSPNDSTTVGSNQIWWDFFPEDDQSFWVRTSAGIDLFRNNRFEHVIKNDNAMSMKRTADGRMLFGLTGAKLGLYASMKSGDHYTFDVEPITALGCVFEEDRKGRLWISRNRKLFCYEGKTGSAAVFTKEDGVSLSLDILGVQQTSDGILMLRKDNVISLLDPLSFEISKQTIKPVLTHLFVNNKEVAVGESSPANDAFFIKEDISLLDELVLDYKHNNFTLEFSAMQMSDPNKNLYHHRLDGYDVDWIESSANNRIAAYTNLDPGTYTFRVRATNHHGVWDDHEAILSVIILPPPWKTTWAYAGYVVLAVALLIVARRNILARERLKSNLRLSRVQQEKEHFELEKAKEIDKVKSTFFANISHEFRTPLTLIKGPVQEMIEEVSDQPKVKERLNLIHRNADIVLKLINQLLDLAKLESGNLTVERTQNDLNTFLNAVINSFSSLAFQKNISLNIILPSVRYVAAFDQEKLESVLVNLINNAIKFTSPGGRVKVIASVGDSSSQGVTTLVVTVSDTGIGIPADQQKKVFERFHQVSEAHKEIGTGIGLSLAKELVELMDGTLTLTSEPGKGSNFTLILPVDVTQTSNEVEPVGDVDDTIDVEAASFHELEIVSGEDSRPCVLVVEDNDDLRKFIIESLGHEFRFLEASDGVRGLSTALENMPDLIISDVMMPEMDGITMTGKLKNDTRTSHIPIILLTAKTSDESKMSGLQTGADDYLTKPFNKNELLLKVRNSIALRVKLREKLKLDLLKESPNVEVQSADEKFLLKVRDAILSRLSDEQLSVESLADEIGLSRSQLFRKISALTGASVNELIRTFRLQRAAQLIEQNWGPVTQVAYEVGYSNLSYFSKAFKEKYGVLPSEYAIKTQ